MVSSYYPFTVRRIGQLASEICAPTQSKTVGCSNGNAEDKLKDGTRAVDLVFESIFEGRGLFFSSFFINYAFFSYIVCFLVI